MDVASSRYSKPFTSVPEQVELLRRTGMEVDDSAAAELVLRQIGYYRLSGYTHFFRERPAMRRFAPGTTLQRVMSVYSFDEKLRGLLLEGIAQLEPALRFHVGHRLGRSARFAHRHGSFLNEPSALWTQGSHGVVPSKHATWLQHFGRQERISQETFVQHFRRRYGPHLPVWVATEVMTLGTLTRLFDLMPENDRKLVASRFGLLTASGDGDPGTLSNWLNFVRHVRNICAHHSRVWNRALDVTLVIPSSAAVPEVAHLNDFGRRRLYGVLVALRFLIARVDPQSDWYARVLSEVTDFGRSSGIRMATMGFPRAWESEKLWAPRYAPDFLLRDVVDAIDAIDTVNRPGAMGLVATRGDESARKKWIRYLVSRRALIAHSLGQQQHIPTFQFQGGDISVPVAEANARLFARVERTEGDHRRATLLVQSWWTTRNPAHGFDEAPISALASAPEAVVRASASWSNGAVARQL